MGRINKFNEIIPLKGSATSKELSDLCFKHFDANRDDALNIAEFTCLCNELFCDENDREYHFEARHISEMFYIFDRNKDGKIDIDEFEFCWSKWLTKVLWPVSCLLAVDVQNDFISGTLALKNCPACQDGAEVIPVINNLISNIPFHAVFYSLDWHPENHISFFDNMHLRPLVASCQKTKEEYKLFEAALFEGPQKVEQQLWPTHCVQNSWGAKLHSDLKIADNSVFIYKGTHPDVDSYSAFWDNSKLSQTKLAEELAARDVTDVFICGLAYDVCVGSTANDSLEMGFRTVLVEDATRGVVAGDIDKTKDKLHNRDAVIVDSDKVEAMVKGLDRRPQLAYRAALLLANQ